MSALGIGPAEFLTELARELGADDGRGATPAAAWRALDDFFATNRYQGAETVLLIDDADEAEPATIAQLTRLAQYPGNAGGALTIVIAGRESHVTALGPRLLDLAELRIDIETWEALDTANFVRQSLATAGGRREIFSSPALGRIHDYAQGLPRRVKQLADLCLLAGAGAEVAQIEVDLVDNVFHELGVIATAAPLA